MSHGHVRNCYAYARRQTVNSHLLHAKVNKAAADVELP